MNITIEMLDDITRVVALNEALGYEKADDYWQRSQRNMDKGERVPMVISVDGVDAGYCFLNRKPKYNLYARLAMYETQDLNVLPDYRQQGLATSLIAYCEDQARTEGCEDIGISVGLTASYGAAQRLYCKLGYLPDGQGITYDRALLGHGDTVTLDDDLCLMMVKSLGA